MHKLVIGSKYTLDGQEKTRWTQFGHGYEKGANMTIRLDHTVIVPPGESVWLNLFKEEDKKNGISEKNDKTEEQKSIS